MQEIRARGMPDPGEMRARCCVLRECALRIYDVAES